MFDQLNLEQIGKRLRQVDQELVALMGQRMRLSLQVEEYKRTRNEAIFRPDVEKRRLDEVCELARHHGMNPEFARSGRYPINWNKGRNKFMLGSYEENTPHRS